jgi:hypothetical protein
MLRDLLFAGVETGRWCRYQQSDVPLLGLHRFAPEEQRCPAGVQANIQMLAYLLTEGCGDAALLRSALERVRQWVRMFREGSASYRPVR